MSNWQAMIPSFLCQQKSQINTIKKKQPCLLMIAESEAFGVKVATAYPTAVLIREKALVVHLESIRMIICKDQLLLIGVPMAAQPGQSVFPSPDSPFVQELVSRIVKLHSE